MRDWLSNETRKPEKFTGVLKKEAPYRLAIRGLPNKLCTDHKPNFRKLGGPASIKYSTLVNSANQTLDFGTFLAGPRFQTYLDHCSNDRKVALAAYTWNSKLAAELSRVLGHVEVVLRNAMDSQLRTWNLSQPRTIGNQQYNDARSRDGGNSAEWLKHPAPALFTLVNTRTRSGKYLSTYEGSLRRAIEGSNERDPAHPRHGAHVTHDDVIAHTTFGFWSHLLPNPKHRNVALGQLSSHERAKEYAARLLWSQALSKGFPGISNEYVIQYYLQRAHALRNRIAHHEPLLNTHVKSYFRTSTRLLNAINLSAGSWVGSTAEVVQILRNRPF